MGNKYGVFGKLYNFFGYFIKMGRLTHHIIGNPGQIGNELWDGYSGIDKRLEGVKNIVSVRDNDTDFSDPLKFWAATGGFDINNGIFLWRGHDEIVGCNDGYERYGKIQIRHSFLHIIYIMLNRELEPLLSHRFSRIPSYFPLSPIFNPFSILTIHSMSAPSHPPVLERFLRYVVIDTQSDETSQSVPSTEKQKNLGRLLVDELQQMGVSDAHIDDHGYVYATIPANTDKESVPVICFCSHMDTSPDAPGAGIKPIVHHAYSGGSIVLPDDPDVVLDPKDHPDLLDQIGNDIVTASGTTLLGADNKAGLAAIMTATHRLLTDPTIRHGKIRILFTPDEEIGRGVDHVDMEKLGADFGYTVDGEKLGTLEDETFSADRIILTVKGVSIHPGFAKGKLESALKAVCDIVARLPKDGLSPETTSEKDGFLHPYHLSGTVEEAQLQCLVRDFDESSLEAHANVLKRIAEEVMKQYPASQLTFQIEHQYRNMKSVLDQHPQVISHAMEAMKRAGIEPLLRSIRGGTDGSRLSLMGLPCPNIFAGEHAFHSREEWVSVQDMEKSVETILNLAAIWEEQS